MKTSRNLLSGRHLVPLTFLGAISLTSLAALANPLSGDFQFSVQSSYYNAYPHVATDLQSDGGSWTASPASLSANVTAHGNATVFGSGSAAWAADGNSGSMTMDYGWSAAAGVDALVNTAAAGGANWDYTFVADVDGFFTLNYNIVAAGVSNWSRFGLPYFGLQGYDIYQGGGTGPGSYNVDLRNAFDPTTNGQYVVPVLAGSLYSFHIVNGGNLSGMGVGQGHGDDVATDVSVHAEFNWTLPGAAVPSVPDATSTLALLGLGLGGLGVLSWRLRRIQAAG